MIEWSSDTQFWKEPENHVWEDCNTNEEVIKGQIRELVRGSVEETLNELVEAEAAKLTQAARYERSEARQGNRSGHYDRKLTTTSGEDVYKRQALRLTPPLGLRRGGTSSGTSKPPEHLNTIFA